MSWWAIGQPGQAARVIMSAQTKEQLAPQIREGEVVVSVKKVGGFTIGPDGLVAVPRVPPASEQMEEVRAIRNALLAGCDKYMLPDYPISEADRAAWGDYRQALRDITESQPDAIEWPLTPLSIAPAP